MPYARPIYLDYNATTPLTPNVIAAMRPFLEEHFGNPSSNHHFGQIAKAAVEKARRQVAALISANPAEIIFTSGGTESNNLALQGTARTNASKGKHIITTAIEHPAVKEVCAFLASQGFQVTTLPVDHFGQVSPDELAAALTTETILVSIMHANNEVGTIQPIQALADLAHKAGALFHTDAAQSVGKLPVNVNTLGVDLLSIAGHKLYGPKGVGALYVRHGVTLEKVTFGAGQEWGMRPGTENVLEIVGLGAAAEEAQLNLDQRIEHLKTMRDRLHSGLEAALTPDVLHLNGHPEERLPNTLNLSFKNIAANALVEKMAERVAASAGAACHADRVEVSSVLKAMHVPLELAKGTLRFSVGEMTTSDEIDLAIKIIAEAVMTMLT
jgi:cysteine desulfurase